MKDRNPGLQLYAMAETEKRLDKIIENLVQGAQVRRSRGQTPVTSKKPKVFS